MNCFSFVQQWYPALSPAYYNGTPKENAKQIKNVLQVTDKIEEIETPQDGCLVLMNGCHIGIFKEGRVWHYDNEKIFESLDTLKYKYKKILFYKVKDD